MRPYDGAMRNFEFNSQVAKKVMGWVDPSTCTPKEGYVQLVPKYDSDPAADYAVLQHVRENWSEANQAKFVAVYYGQTRYSGRDATFILEPLNYQTGDYARAALAVVEEKE